MGSTDRIKEYLGSKGISKYKFYKKTGLSNKFLDNSSNMGTNKAEIILRYYSDINPLWLLTGEGEMLRNSYNIKINNDKVNESIIKYENKKRKEIPLIPIQAMIDWGKGDFQMKSRGNLMYNIPEFERLNVDFLIQVKGNSMYPKYNNGDIVACRKLPLDTFFQWNKVYVLDTIQGAIIKRIKKSMTTDSIKCVSDNKEYDSFDINILNELNSLAIVLGAIQLE